MKMFYKYLLETDRLEIETVHILVIITAIDQSANQSLFFRRPKVDQRAGRHAADRTN